MPKPVCVKCRLFFKPKKTGAVMEEGMPNGGDGKWGPYKLWVGDLMECRGCGDQIMVGFGRGPIAEHYQPDYAAQVQRFAPLFRVDDC